MKASMIEWVGGIKNLPAWFKHGEEKDISLEEVQELFNTGNNIMLCHYKSESDEDCVFLAVDDKRFTQR